MLAFLLYAYTVKARRRAPLPSPGPRLGPIDIEARKKEPSMFFSLTGRAISLRKASPYDLNDFLFSPSELQDKYATRAGHAEHPHFSRAQWLQTINRGASQAGYWQWVFEQVQADDETYLLRH
jgi:hypothetical protein